MFGFPDVKNTDLAISKYENNIVNGYKHYPPDSVARLLMIRQAKKLGFSLTEIAQSLDLLITEQVSDVEAEDRLTYVLDQVRAGRCSLQLPHAERDPAPVHPPT